MDLLLAVVVLLALPALWIFYLLYSNASLGRKLTYATLARSTIFPRIDCNTETSASARYTARFPADDLPRFAYNDPHLASYAISKFDKAIEALGVQNRACPGDSAVLWKVVTRHIVKGGYTREDWVSSLMSHMSSFLGFLPEDLLPDAELFTRYPALWASQKGDLNFIVETTKGRGITGIKCTKVLDKLDHELTTATVFPEGSLQHAQGILMKMGLQLQDLQRTSVTTARFGVIVSGTDCYVVELVHVQVRGRRFPGLAVSDRIPLSPSSVDGGRSQSLATLLLGLLIPPHIVPDPPRDPAMHVRPEDWTFIIKNLPGDRGRGGGRGKGRGGSGGGGRSGSGGGGGGRGGAQDRRHRCHGGGGRREGEGEGDNRGDCPSNHQIALEPGTPMLIRRRESEAFGGPLPLVVVECNDIEEHWTRGPPFDDQDTASGGSSSRSASPVPSHTSRSTVASESSQEGSCATAPSSICTPHSPANVPTIELTSTIHTAELADVARATFHKDGHTSHAVLKTYDATGFRQVVAEVRAYETLRDLQGTTVAAQIGIVAPLHWSWVGLLMEDAGDPLGCGEDWAALGPLERKSIYSALVRIHEMGVQHGDVAPRNIVRRPDGGIAFIDFGCAEQHRCPGRDACRELLEMEKELCLTYV